MGRLDSNPDTWLPQLRTVLTAIASALRGRSPTPALLFALLQEYKHCIPDSTVDLEFYPEGYSDDPEEQPEYVVSLTGPFSPSWLILQDDLHKFVRSCLRRH